MLLQKMKLALLGVLTVGFVFAGAAVSTQALTPEQTASGVEKAAPATPKDDTQLGQADLPRAKRLADSAPAPKESKVRKLLQERLDIVRAQAERVRKLQQTGAASPEVVRQAALRVLKAELELCETDKERIAVQERIVGLLKETENRLRQVQQQGTASRDVVEDATLDRLEAEIALERLKEKANPPSK